ncbi:uncharacterized protein PITG_22237, partial [Phytophthora infestans T30-4]
KANNQTETDNQQKIKPIQQYMHKYVTTQTTSNTEARVSSTQEEMAEESEALEKEEECEAALAAAGKGVTKQAADTEKLCTSANHYADQRNRSVKASVTMNYWVSPEHIKTMAMHAREMVFVLDVLQEEKVMLQEYGYEEMEMPDKTVIETGTLKDKTRRMRIPEQTKETQHNKLEEEKQKGPSGSCCERMNQYCATEDAEVHKEQEIATITGGEASKSTTAAIRNSPTAHYPPSVTTATAMKVPGKKEGIADQDAKTAHGPVQPPKEPNGGGTN